MWNYQNWSLLLQLILLDLAVVKLTFFTAACMVLYFRFERKTVDKTTEFLAVAEQCLYSSEACIFSHSAPAVSRLGMRKGLEEDTVRTADLENTSYQITSRSSIRTWGGFSCKVDIAQRLSDFLLFPWLIKPSLSWPQSFLAFALPVVP